jgi:hypothetical protein
VNLLGFELTLADYLVWFGLISATLNISGNIPYAIDVARNPNIKPSFPTWTIWGSLDALRIVFSFIAGFIQYQAIGSIVAICIILGIGYRKGKLIPWTRVDVVVALLILAGMCGTYYVSGTPLSMLVASLVALTLGSLSMFWKTIKEPHSEPLVPWIMFFGASLFQFLSLPEKTLVEISVPCWYMVLMGILIITIIVRRAMVGAPTLAAS